MLETVDVFPTLVELCGLPTVEQFEGTSMVPLVDAPDRPWKSAAFSQYPRGGEVMGRALRTDRCRYVEWVRPNGQVTARELYDHQTDAGETRNLANEPAQREVIERLGRQLRAGWKAARPPK